MKNKHRQKIFTTLLSLLLLGFLAIRAQLQTSNSFTQILPSYTNQAVTTPTSTIASVGSQLATPATLLSGERAVVAKVIDGDTIELADGRKLRYIGIDTPETVDPRRAVGCFGPQASAKNRELVLGKEVILEKDVSDTDRYGRLLRYVYLDGVMVNDLLVRFGFAQASSYPPDVKYQEKFRTSQAQAKQEQLGIWGQACALSPQQSSQPATGTNTTCPTSCRQAAAMGMQQIEKNHPCYHSSLDGDGDGIACE